jgi:hypothetical protein
MIIQPLGPEVAVTDAAITAARLIRISNAHASDVSAVALANVSGVCGFTLMPLSSEVVEKDIGAAVTATGGTVKATPVAFTN